MLMNVRYSDVYTHHQLFGQFSMHRARLIGMQSLAFNNLVHCWRPLGGAGGERMPQMHFS